MRTRIVVAALLALLAFPVQAQEGDVVGGRVLGTDSVPVAGVQVAVRSVRTLQLRTATTGTDGRYRVAFPESSPAYEISARRVGLAPGRTRAERAAPGEVEAPTIVLREAAVAVAGITASGRRPPAPRSAASNPLPPERTASQRWVDGSETRADQGDLAAVAGTNSAITLFPGEEGGPDRFSVAGAGPDQNRVTVNGLAFEGGALPYFARLQGYATTATADAGRGGFAGGEVAVSLWSGASLSPEFKVRAVSVEPGLQMAGPDADRFGLRYRERLVNAHYQRWLLPSRLSVSLAVDVEQRTSALASALSSGEGTARGFGLAPDSAARLRAILQGAGIPLELDGVPGEVTRDRFNVLVNAGFHRLPWGLTGGAHASVEGRSLSPSGAGATALATAGGENDQRDMNAGLRLARDFGNGYLNELSASWSGGTDRSSPFLRLPAARVTVASDLGDGERGLAGVAFGGSPVFPRDIRRGSGELQHRVSWLTYGRRHRLSIGAWGRGEWYRQRDAANALGTFAFNSLADLEEGRPASYTRTLGGREREASSRSVALFADDVFSPGERLQFRFGGRLEGTRLSWERGGNPLVDSLFGVRSGRAPSELRFLPRAGFSWNSGTGLLARRRAPWGQMSANAGEYMGRIAPAGVAQLADRDGLPGGSRVLYCVGGAAPTPDWAAYAEDPASVPSGCADGAAGTPLASATPWVTVYGDGYGAVRRRAANVDWWADTRLGPRLQLAAAYSRAVAQSGQLDLNLDRTARFALPDEEGRPVFSPLGSVVPASGAVGLLPSRRDERFGVVQELRADGVAEATQLTVGLAPARRNLARLQFNGSYTWSRHRALSREFAVDDPTRLSWGAGGDARHAVQGTANVPLSTDRRRLSSIFVRGRLQSGIPYTPVVAGDVNGDGAFNDAAFVFDPARAADPALAAGMRALLDGARGDTRECLRRQLGRVAGRNSCTGPWSAALDVELQSVVPTPVGRSASISLRALNVLGGLDHLVNGERELRGWGERAAPDRVLLSVRGFEPDARRFRYEVNPRFGSAAAGQARFRSPFVVRLEVNLTFARSTDRVAVDNVALQVQRARSTADSARVVEGYLKGFSNVMRYLSDEGEGGDMLLTREQVQELARFADAYEAEVATLTRDALAYLRTAIGRDPAEEVVRRVAPVREAREEVYLRYLREVKRVLARDQWQTLDPGLTNRVDIGRNSR